MRTHPIPGPEDDALAREIEAALAVDPEPGFVTRCRARIAREPVRSARRFRFLLAVPAIALVALLAVFAFQRHASVPDGLDEAVAVPQPKSQELPKAVNTALPPPQAKVASVPAKSVVPAAMVDAPLDAVRTPRVWPVMSAENLESLQRFLDGLPAEGPAERVAGMAALPAAIQIPAIDIAPIKVEIASVAPIEPIVPLVIEPIPPFDQIAGGLE